MNTNESAENYLETRNKVIENYMRAVQNNYENN